jgi:DNA primase
VDYLHSLGYQEQKIRNYNYWYLSPLRDEREASFKVNREKNIWYDHGLGKGGQLVDFACEYFNCSITEGLRKISSFHQQKSVLTRSQNMQFHRRQDHFLNANDTPETTIKIILLPFFFK